MCLCVFFYLSVCLSAACLYLCLPAFLCLCLPVCLPVCLGVCLRIPSSNALPLSHRDFTVSEVHNEVHLTRVLHTARIRTVDSVMFEGRVNDMVDLRGCPSQKPFLTRHLKHNHIKLFINRKIIKYTIRQKLFRFSSI